MVVNNSQKNQNKLIINKFQKNKRKINKKFKTILFNEDKVFSKMDLQYKKELDLKMKKMMRIFWRLKMMIGWKIMMLQQIG